VQEGHASRVPARPGEDMAELDGVFYKEIVEQSLREFPNEACGLIAAEAGVPVRVYPITNAYASAITYRMDDTEQLRVFDELDERGWEIWAFYHSHTHSEAYPSKTDFRDAHFPDGTPTYPGVRYLVLSLSDRNAPVLRSFTFAERKINEEELTVT
jgi:[CysO sulfur-carrier protein]-S-L-cysteine hydrolase